MMPTVLTDQAPVPMLATWDIRSEKTTNFSDGCPK